MSQEMREQFKLALENYDVRYIEGDFHRHVCVQFLRYGRKRFGGGPVIERPYLFEGTPEIIAKRKRVAERAVVARIFCQDFNVTSKELYK